MLYHGASLAVGILNKESKELNMCDENTENRKER